MNVSYTLDAFGGIRRQSRGIAGRRPSIERFALEASYLSLTANVVTAAITEASLRAQIAATEDIAHAQQMQLDITQRRVTAGGASRTDVLQQQATLQATLREPAGICALSSRRSAICSRRTWARCPPTMTVRDSISNR